MSLSEIERLNSFIELCTKYQAHDPRYTHLEHVDGEFHDNFVGFAFCLFGILAQAPDDSSIKHAYGIWRNFHYGDSRRAYIFFEYAKALQSDFINRIWLHQWDAKDRNIDIEREITCRIFILSGRTAREIHEAGLKSEN